MKENKPFRISDRAKSFSYALQGVATFFRTQHNAWIHLIAAVIAVALGVWFDIGSARWCMVIIAIAMVFITEMLNTAVEFLTDLVSPQFHPLAKMAKDVAAASVLFAAIAAGIIGMIVFLPEMF
jgi:diacylglycerol kinase